MRKDRKLSNGLTTLEHTSRRNCSAQLSGKQGVKQSRCRRRQTNWTTRNGFRHIPGNPGRRNLVERRRQPREQRWRGTVTRTRLMRGLTPWKQGHLLHEAVGKRRVGSHGILAPGALYVCCSVIHYKPNRISFVHGARWVARVTNELRET